MTDFLKVRSQTFQSLFCCLGWFFFFFQGSIPPVPSKVPFGIFIFCPYSNNKAAPELKLADREQDAETQSHPYGTEEKHVIGEDHLSNGGKEVLPQRIFFVCLHVY